MLGYFVPNRARMLLAQPTTNRSPKGDPNRRRQQRRRKRRAAKKARRRGGSGYVPEGLHALVDTLNRDLTVPVRHVRFYDACENTRISVPQRLPLSYKGYFKLGIYSANELTYVRSRKQRSCNNKLAKIFGIDPKKDKRWAALLRCVACCGLTKQDFRSVMRIRDLKVRGKWRSYKKAITGFIAKLPARHRERALPLAKRNKRVGILESFSIFPDD